MAAADRKRAADLIDGIREYGGYKVLKSKVGRCMKDYWTAEFSLDQSRSRDGCWYGWSHRAIYGFQPGVRVEENLPVGFIAESEEDARTNGRRVC